MLIGRAEILARLAALEDRPLVTLVGPPGAGKSAVLRHYTGAATAIDDATQLAAWRAAHPGAPARVTARAPLHLADEIVLVVPPLSPEDALALLIERVTAAGGQPSSLAELARATGGLPLVIELLAPHVAALGSAAVLERIDAIFAHGLDRAPRDADPRHASWALAMAPSWSALTPDERAALAQCSVFRGGFTLAAAEAVIDPPLIEALCDRGLLVRDGAMFTCPRPIAAFAAARAPLGDAVERHAAYTLAHPDVENLIAVCERALSVEAALRLSEQPAPLDVREKWVEAALRLREDPALLAARGDLKSARGRFEEARADQLRALENAGDQALAAKIEGALCSTCRRLRAFDEARAHGERALTLHRAIGSPPAAETRALGALAALMMEAGALEEARVAFDALRKRAHKLGDRWSAALSIAYVGHIDHEQGRLGLAGRAFWRAHQAFAEAGDQRLAAVFEGYRATVLHEQGEIAEARDLYIRAIGALHAVGAQAFEGLFSACLGAAHAELGETNEALEALERAEPLIDASEDPALALVLRIHRLHTQPSAADIAAVEAQAAQLEARSDDVRFALRLLSSRLAARSGPALRVSAEGFAAPGGEPVSLARRPPLLRILRALADARASSPGAVVPVEAIVRAGWGDERILPRSAAQRVRVAIAELRSMGLREVLLSKTGGYLLDPAVDLIAI